MNNVHLFIPVKHESQRIPGKNFRPILGKPLWVRCVHRFEEYFTLYINTDSPDIIKEVEEDKKFGWRVHARRRENYLCGHDVSVNKLINHFVSSELMVLSDDIVVQIHVTSPFLTPETVMRAVSYIKDEGYDSVVGCNVLQSRLWREEGELGLVPVNHDPRYLHPTQHLPPFYEENSALYAFRVSAFETCRNRICFKPKFMPIGFPENVDVDTEENWQMVLKLAALEGNR